jgi:YHS domain-containing protein
MTAQRQERNGNRSGTGFRRGMALMGLAGGLAWAGLAVQALCGLPARAATTERVVINRYSGLAIEGFDPVAYFVDARPLVGRAEFEASEAGAVWRFRNEGNRASFVAHPDIYGPRFGGYDPFGLARGVTYAGNPRFWLISGDRLYLFGREENRDAFAADPAHFLRAASTLWPVLEQNLAQ